MQPFKNVLNVSPHKKYLWFNLAQEITRYSSLNFFPVDGVFVIVLLSLFYIYLFLL